MQPKGSFYGLHRVIEPENTLPQPAYKVDNNFTSIFDNEILCNVKTLNIDSASFTQIREEAKDDLDKIAEKINYIVKKFGKLKNPVTGSGGMFIGQVHKIGLSLQKKINLKEGDQISSLVSLSQTPLRIDEILKIHLEKDQVDIKGQAILFESSLWIKLPDDMPPNLALAVLDVAGAPAQVERLVKKGDIVAVLGASGKSGLLSCYQAKKKVGPKGKVIALEINKNSLKELEKTDFIDEIIIGNAAEAVDLLEKISQVTDSKLCDVVISCVSRENCEMGAILITRTGGKVYFFSMATDFAKAALGAEGIGKDIEMIIGNGYCRGHDQLALNIMRENPYLRNLFTTRYC